MSRGLRYIYLAFGLSITIVVLVSSLLSKTISTMIVAAGKVEHTHQVKNQIQKVQLQLLKAESAQREYLLTENDDLLRPLRQTQKDIFKEIDSLRLLTTDNPDQQKIIVRLKKTVSSRYQILYQTINSEKDVQLSEFLNNASKGDQALEDFMLLSQKMDDAETRLLLNRTTNKVFYEKEAPKYLILILIISCVLQIISFLALINEFKRRVRYEINLKNKIQELNAANAEMEQITFVASHDLQEPLRKIRTFSDKLLNHYKKTDAEGELIANKISFASVRMQELLSDLISYIKITKNDEAKQLVNLESILKDACKDFEKEIISKQAVINIDPLPAINGYYKQLLVLFSNLIDNSLKFSQSCKPVIIHVKFSKVPGTEVSSNKPFIKISFSDNGLGFKAEYAEKIFVIFQRLINSDENIPGKGIGLAICKRIMINHKGYITAEGKVNEGATFNIYFPEE